MTLGVKKFLILIMIVLFWHFLIFFVAKQNFLIPGPLEVFEALVDNIFDGEIFIHIFFSMQRVLVGFAIASICAISLALFLGYKNKTGELILPIIEILRPIPPIAWIPIAILIFGLGNNSAYFIVFLGAFFPIFTNAYFGVCSLPRTYRNVALSYEIKVFSYIKDILFYYSLPYIFTGLKIGIGMAWMSVIAAELIGAQSGLGYYIQINRLLLRTDNIIVGMILIGIIGYMLVKFILLIEIKTTPWIKK